MPLPVASGLLVLALAVHRQPELVLPGSVLDVAASPTTLAAVRERDVVLLASNGRVLARRTRPTAAAEPASNSGGDGVLGTRTGLLALISGVALREERQHLVELRGLRGRQIEILQASPDGAHVVAGVGRRLLMSHDGGDAFALAAELPRPARAVAVSPDGAIFAADALGAWRVDGDRRVPVLAGPIADLCWCDEALVALAPGGRIEVVGPVGRRTSPAPAASALRCGSAPGSAWVLAGPGLWTSSDGGRSWKAHPDVPLPVRSAVELGGVLWIAAGAGLVQQPGSESSEAARPLPPGFVAEPPRRRAPGWAFLLPRVAVGFAVDDLRALSGEALFMARPTRAFELQLCLVFRMGQRWPVATLTTLARERLRQRALLSLTRGGQGPAAAAVRETTQELQEDLP